MTEFKPDKAIVALFATTPSHQFVGTGFFIDCGFLVTAQHVVDNNKSLLFGVEIADTHDPAQRRSQLQFKSATVVAMDQSADLAILTTSEYICPCPLPIDTTPLLGIETAYCFEYSRSNGSSTGNFYVESSTRVGNVVRYVDDKRTSPLFPPDSLELSFPAIKGASGAPIMSCRGKWAVIGIMKANAMYELLPIQSIKVMDEIDNKPISEQTTYYLPHGLAVNSKHLKTFINKHMRQTAKQ
ncbi:MAG: serine protease [Nitrosomonas sp.]|nr:serine protease [Nitrosomonas sp.]